MTIYRWFYIPMIIVIIDIEMNCHIMLATSNIGGYKTNP